MTASTTTQDAQALDKTRTANETQTFRDTDKELYLNELEQVSWWYRQQRAFIIDYLSHQLDKDNARPNVTNLGGNDEAYDVKI